MPQSVYEKLLKDYMREHSMNAEHLVFRESCHSVEEAARAANAKTDDFIKSICMVDAQGTFIVAIVKGEDKASAGKIGELLKVGKPKPATPQEMLEKTRYPCGGTPPFGYEAKFLIDSRVMEKEFVYGGGGSENSLVRIYPKELQKANGGTVADIRRD